MSNANVQQLLLASTKTKVTATFIASYNGRINGGSSTYSTARSTSNAFGDADGRVGQEKPGTTTINVLRQFIKFDTSSIPDTATITKVNLRLVVKADLSTNDFDVKIKEQDWSGQDPISDGNREAAYDGCLAEADVFQFRNTSGIATNTQYSSSDLTTGYVSKTGSTYYSLISSRDISATAPANSTYKIVDFYPYNDATESYRPALVVEYEV